MGMVKKLLASGIAAKLIQEARKPENQAKIKQAIADFQAKRANQAKRPGTH
jgi:ABC-type Zn2+ transport system substrate-binding protein/surface adhesin